MAFLLMITRLYHKPGTSMNILGAAALILLVTDPQMLFDVGFQLSFIAVIIILTTLPAVRTLLPPKYRYRKAGALFQFIMVSILVQGGLYPLLIHYFNEFSIAGPASNTLAVPFVQAMFLWSFFCLVVSLFNPEAATLLNIPGDYILTVLTEYVTWIGSHPSSWIEGTLPGPVFFGIWFFAFSTLASMRIPSLRWKMVCGFLLFFNLFQAAKIMDHFRTSELKVTFFDVGQGDAVLLQTPGGYNYLYDTGIWSPSFDSGERTLIPELRASGVTRLDGVILSHPHADHIGGIISIMKHIPIDTIYQSPVTYDSGIYHRYMDLATEKGIPIRLLSSGDLIATDRSMPMLVLAPSDNIPASDPNNRSVVLQIRYGETGLLLTGDAEKEAEAFLVDTYGSFLESDLLKIGHHASRTSSTEPFLSMVNARKGAASLSINNRYDHPHPEATRRLMDSGIAVRYTSLEGAIIFKSNGRYYRHVPWRDKKVAQVP
jgi:competence protein ComEC